MIKSFQFRRCILLALISLLVLNLVGCSQYREETIRTELTNEVQSFYEHLLLRDLDSLMKHFDPESESYYSHYKEFRNSFKEFKNSYDVKDIVFTELGKKEAKISSSVTVSGVHSETEEFLSYDVIHSFVFVLNNNKEWKINSFNTNYNIVN